MVALKVCNEILESFKNSDYSFQGTKKGIFSNLDTTQAEKINKDEIIETCDVD